MNNSKIQTHCGIWLITETTEKLFGDNAKAGDNTFSGLIESTLKSFGIASGMRNVQFYLS